MNPDLRQILIATIPSIIPCFMVGFGILINKNDTSRLGAEIAALRTRMDSRFDTLTKELHDNVVMLVNVGNELDKRMSRLEDKS